MSAEEQTAASADEGTTGGVQLTEMQEARAARLHGEAIVIDCGSKVLRNDAFIARARRGGATAVSHHPFPAAELVGILHEIRNTRRWIDAREDVCLVTGSADIRNAKSGGRLGVMIGPQNAEYLGTDLDLVGVVAYLGVRLTQLTYQRQNHVGSGCGEKTDSGLTRLGGELLVELASAGIVADLAHAGSVTARDAIEAAPGPVVISHGHPAALSPHIRASKDDVLERLAAKGGVIGITGCSQFLYYPSENRRRPRMDRWVEHVLYVAELVGIDHVGIGMDFDEDTTASEWNSWPFPELTNGWPFEHRRCDGLVGIDTLGNVTRALVAAGLSDEDIRKVLGLNFLRVFDSVWKP